MKITLLLPAALVALGMSAAPAAHANTMCSSLVEAGPNTSCPFAMAVYNTFVGGAGTMFDVVSPTTGQNYTMSCRIEQHGATTCRGGNDAEVIIH